MLNDSDLEAWEYYNEAFKERMTMDQYQRAAAKTAIYNSTHSILYPALGLAGEAGEVANKVKKMIRDNNFDRQGIAAEIGDSPTTRRCDGRRRSRPWRAWASAPPRSGGSCVRNGASAYRRGRI